MISLNQLGVIPALLIIQARMTILHGNDKEKTVRRFLFFDEDRGATTIGTFYYHALYHRAVDQPFFPGCLEVLYLNR